MLLHYQGYALNPMPCGPVENEYAGLSSGSKTFFKKNACMRACVLHMCECSVFEGAHALAYMCMWKAEVWSLSSFLLTVCIRTGLSH